MKIYKHYISIPTLMAALTVTGLRQVDAAAVALQNATATFSQTTLGTFPVAAAIDGDLTGAGGWAIHPQEGQNQTAVFETQSDTGFAGGTTFLFTFLQLYPGHTMGRFRLSITTDDRSTFADGLQSGGDVTANWMVLDPITFTSQNGATLTKQPDLSILASGFSPNTDIYTITTSTTLIGITGIRLEMLSDASLPLNGPGRSSGNGNFVLTEMTVETMPEPLPQLRITVPAPSEAALSWPTNADGFALVTTFSLPASSWIAVTNVPVILGSSFSVTVPAPNAQQYFRLYHQ
jgi:hypothetical protein